MIQASKFSVLLACLFSTTTSGAAGSGEGTPKLRFAYANEQGTQLLIPSADPVIGATLLTRAVCTGGALITTKHIAYKHEAKDSTHRQSLYNFEKDGGERYKVDGAKLRTDASCALAEENFFAERTLAHSTLVNEKLIECSAADRSAIENARHRKLKWCRKRWLIDGKVEATIGFAQFTKAGKQGLAVMARLDGAKSQIIEEYPTEMGEWRVDEGDNGAFPATAIQLVAAWWTKDGNLGLATEWGAPESDNLVGYEERASIFVRIGESDFYWAPI